MTAVQRHLVVMAAGTGGHVIPGLAVAREMQSRGWTVSWLGTAAGMENRLVPPSGIPMDTLAFTGLRGHGLLHTLTGGLRLLKAFWDALGILRRRSADVVLGMGGYVCFPGGLMASLLGKPLMLVNADAALLMSNKALLPVADRVAFGFDGPAVARVKQGLVTGNPVRAEIEQMAEPAQRFAGRQGPLKLLLVGGSLGAKVLNETLPEALALMPAERRPQVTHQTGLAHLDSVRASYDRLGVRGRDPALHRQHGRAPGRLRCDRLPRGGHHGERAVRGRRGQRAGAAGGQHHLAPARQRPLDGRAGCRSAPAADRIEPAAPGPAPAEPGPGAAANHGHPGAHAGAVPGRGQGGR